MKTIKEATENAECIINENGALEGLYAIKDEDGYFFAEVDEDGNMWPLGSATEDGEDGFSGSFDTKSINFDDDDDLMRIIKNRNHENIAII